MASMLGRAIQERLPRLRPRSLAPGVGAGSPCICPSFRELFGLGLPGLRGLTDWPPWWDR